MISYYQFGQGTKTVVCFHGYEQEGKNYQFLEKYAGNEYTFYALDLPFHGQTEWNEGLLFDITMLQTIVKEIINKGDIEPQTPTNKIILIGFSLGARMALHLYQHMANRVERIVLLAPDGLKVNFWYWLATQTWLGNKFFALTMKHPSWFLGLLQVLHRFKLMNSSIFKFTNYHISDVVARKKLFNRWTALRKIKPNLIDIKEKISGGNTFVGLVYGSHDRIILSSIGEKFRKGIEDKCKLTIINSGHQLLHQKYADIIIKNLGE